MVWSVIFATAYNLSLILKECSPMPILQTEKLTLRGVKLAQGQLS